MKGLDLVFASAIACLIILGSGLVHSAVSRDRGVRTERTLLTAPEIMVQEDAHAARIKTRLRLQPDQEKEWPILQAALHNIAAARTDRAIASRLDREKRKEPGGFIEYLNDRARSFENRANDLAKLAEAAQPLYSSLFEQQKSRFAREIVRPSRGREQE